MQRGGIGRAFKEIVARQALGMRQFERQLTRGDADRHAMNSLPAQRRHDYDGDGPDSIVPIWRTHSTRYIEIDTSVNTVTKPIRIAS